MKTSGTQQEGSSCLNGRAEIGRKEGSRFEGKVGRRLTGKEERRSEEREMVSRKGRMLPAKGAVMAWKGAVMAGREGSS